MDLIQRYKVFQSNDFKNSDYFNDEEETSNKINFLKKKLLQKLTSKD